VATLSGGITAFLDALDHPEDADPVQAVVRSRASEPEVEEFEVGPRGRERYLSFKGDGVELKLEKGRVAAVFVHLRPTGVDSDHSPYPEPGMLVDGLTAEPTRAAVMTLLGAAVRSSDDPAWDLFEVDGRFANFTYDGDVLARVTVMVDNPTTPLADDVEGLELDADGSIDAPGGEIDTLFSAFGESTDDALATLMLLAGTEPQMRHEKIERDGVEWLYVSLAGVDLQFKEGTLVGALVRVAREDGLNYRRAGELFDDLRLPTGRREVRTAFGTPKVSSPTQVPGESFDLYDLTASEFTAGQDLALSLDYHDDQVISVSVLRRGVGVA
jgi:hypothetical protein